MLYVIPTPIGNLKDITHRSITILQEVDLILAEDTRVTSKLLKHYDINKPLRAFHAHNEHRITEQLILRLQEGERIALVSDAGTPGISDPGYLLLNACYQNDIEVDILPGATAFVPALLFSGLPNHHFHFEGFLPHKKGRQTRLKYLAALPDTFILYESPHRLVKCLDQLLEHCGPERKACVCRELTKLYQDISRGTLEELLQKSTAGTLKSKGEIVIVVDGKVAEKTKKSSFKNHRE